MKIKLLICKMFATVNKNNENKNSISADIYLIDEFKS